MLYVLGYTVSTLTGSSSGRYNNFESKLQDCGYSRQTGSLVVYSIVPDIQMMKSKRIKESNKSDSKWSRNVCLSDWIMYKANYYFQREVHFLWVESFLLLTLYVSGQQ
jgi:hypothetical protein